MSNGENGYEDDYIEEEIKPLTFDDMVSFTMFIEISLIVSSIVIFIIYLYLSS